MKACISAIQRFLSDESGPTAVEYAFMLALIIIVCIAAIQSVGNSTSSTFSDVGQTAFNTGT